LQFSIGKKIDKKTIDFFLNNDIYILCKKLINLNLSNPDNPVLKTINLILFNFNFQGESLR